MPYKQSHKEDHTELQQIGIRLRNQGTSRTFRKLHPKYWLEHCYHGTSHDKIRVTQRKYANTAKGHAVALRTSRTYEALHYRKRLHNHLKRQTRVRITLAMHYLLQSFVNNWRCYTC